MKSGPRIHIPPFPIIDGIDDDCSDGESSKKCANIAKAKSDIAAKKDLEDILKKDLAMKRKIPVDDDISSSSDEDGNFITKEVAKLKQDIQILKHKMRKLIQRQKKNCCLLIKSWAS